MALPEICFIACSIVAGFLVNALFGNPLYWNILIVIGVYLLVNLIIHLVIKFICKPYKSGPEPKHLIIIVTGYLGHYSRIKGIRDSFIKRLKDNNNNINPPDDIMVYCPREANSGFFFWTFWKSNDGINKGGIRLSNEIQWVINDNPSITKISFISCSLGGLYTRYCLKHLFDHNTDNNNNNNNNIYTINGHEVELINFMTLASPHCGCKDWTEQKPFCCSKTLTLYGAGISLSKYHLFPPTLKQLLLLDEEQLIMKMSTINEYLAPLKAFKYRVCFGNAKYDAIVSCASSLILNEDKYNKFGDTIWDKMENDDEKYLIEPVIMKDVENQNEVHNDCWFERLQNEMEWKKFVVCWNYNNCVKKRSHDLLAAPFIWYSGCKPLFNAIADNFQYV